MANLPAHETELTEGEAVAAFEKAVKDHPDAASHFNLGSAYYVVHNLDAASQEFREALALAPGIDHAHYYLGVIYKAQGKNDLARQEFQKVLDGGGHMMLKSQATIQLHSLNGN